MIPSETPFIAQDIRPRPTSGVVMTVASGQQAGKSYGIDGSSFEIGNEPSCDVPVADDSETDHPTGAGNESRRLRVERGSSGWKVHDLGGIGFFVNQSYVRSTSELRSGDIVRLTWKGPDLQFMLQSSAKSLNRLVEQYLPTGEVDQREAELETSVPVMATPVASGPVDDTSPDQTNQSYSARDTRILPSANARGVDSTKNTADDLRKTTHLSHEALAAVQTFQENKRQVRPSIAWLFAAVALVIIVLLSVLAYMILGAG